MPCIPDQEVVQLWYHYEEVAMHFNELIIQYRLQLMGGTGAIGALSSYLIASKDLGENFEKLRALTASVILVLFSAAAYLDVFYYNELLLGAVDALLKFESEHNGIYMSTAINQRFPNGEASAIKFTYIGVIATMSIFTIWTCFAAFRKKK